MAQKTKLGLSAVPMANYNTALFANKTQVTKVVLPHLDFVPFAFSYQTGLGLALMRQPTNKNYT